MKTSEANVVIPQIQAGKLDEIIADINFTIIDVRSEEGIAAQGAIPRAINIPLDLVKEEINKKDENPHSIFNQEGSFLFCCTGGVMSYIASINARESGISNVFNLEGGHAAWIKFKQSKITVSE